MMKRNLLVLISLLMALSGRWAFGASGGISAAPQVCSIANGSNVCSSTIGWSSSGANNPCVFLNTGQLFACGKSGSQTAPWITQSGYRFILKSSNSFSSQTLSSVFVKGQPKPSLSVSFSPSAVSTGQSATLSWSASNATSCSGVNGTSAASGSKVYPIKLTSDWTVRITCSGPGGSVTQSATLKVTPPPAPIVYANFNPAQVVTGESSTLRWNAVNATSCSGIPVYNSQGTSGEHTYPITTTSDWIVPITCSGAGGSTTKTVVLDVQPPPAPSIVAEFTPKKVLAGERATLNWAATNATSCSGIPAYNGSETNGSLSYPITTQTDWTVDITCAGPGGNTTHSVMLEVELPPPPIIEASFQPETTEKNKTVTLHWDSQYATSCSGIPVYNSNETQGTLEYVVTTENDWPVTINCEGYGGTSSKTVVLRLLDSLSAPVLDSRFFSPGEYQVILMPAS